jgi:beta-1,2-mannobiose phosphorylase / 1,2-beta-oligomannan phosphorylase
MISLKNKINNVGIFVNKKKVFFIYKKKGIKKTQAGASRDGLNFAPEKESWAKNFTITNKKGKKVNLENCLDFKISQIKGKKYILFYKIFVNKKIFLKSAFSTDFFNWKETATIPFASESGEVVPKYKFNNNYCVLFGGKSVKIVFTKDFKKWIIGEKLLDQLCQNHSERNDLRFIIVNATIIPEGILLTYGIKNRSGEKDIFSFYNALLDIKNPTNLIWTSQKSFWDNQSWENDQFTFLGSVEMNEKLISYWEIKKGGVFAISHYFPKNFNKIKSRSVSIILLKKQPQNPIISPIEKHFWESKYTFNPAAACIKNKVHLLYRAICSDGVSRFGYACLKDGVLIDERSKEPAFQLKETDFRNTAEKGRKNPYISGGSWCGCEDPRLTIIDNTVYLLFITLAGWQPPRVTLTSIDKKDFLNKKWDRWKPPVFISSPDVPNKNWVLFPRKVNGRYAILHTISPKIKIDYLDNLNFDKGRYIRSDYIPGSMPEGWEGHIRGVGPTPIETEEGWLLFYHAMDKKEPSKYKIGAIITDKNNPEKIISRSKGPVLEPDQHYENTGFKPGVVYSCGAVVKNDDLFLYYGAADHHVCVAKAKYKRFLGKLKKEKSVKMKKINIDNYVY